MNHVSSWFIHLSYYPAVNMACWKPYTVLETVEFFPVATSGLVRIFQRAKVLVEVLSIDLDEALSLAWLASQLALGNRVVC